MLVKSSYLVLLKGLNYLHSQHVVHGDLRSVGVFKAFIIMTSAGV
jgi:serine/threonine protein kinase